MGVIKTSVGLLVLLIATLTTICVYRSIMLFPMPSVPETCDQSSASSSQVAPSGRGRKLKSGVKGLSSLTHVHMNEETVPGLIDRFVNAIKIKTITSGLYQYDKDALLQMHTFIEKSKRYTDYTFRYLCMIPPVFTNLSIIRPSPLIFPHIIISNIIQLVRFFWNLFGHELRCFHPARAHSFDVLIGN